MRLRSIGLFPGRHSDNLGHWTNIGSDHCTHADHRAPSDLQASIGGAISYDGPRSNENVVLNAHPSVAGNPRAQCHEVADDAVVRHLAEDIGLEMPANRGAIIDQAIVAQNGTLANSRRGRNNRRRRDNGRQRLIDKSVAQSSPVERGADRKNDPVIVRQIGWGYDFNTIHRTGRIVANEHEFRSIHPPAEIGDFTSHSTGSENRDPHLKHSLRFDQPPHQRCRSSARSLASTS